MYAACLNAVLAVSRGHGCPHKYPNCTNITASQPVRADGLRKGTRIAKRESKEDMTEKQLKRVATLKKVRSQQEEHKIDISNAESDFQSKKRRRDHIEKKNKLGITEDKRKGNGKGGKNVTANLKDKE